jgi:hypothetical protein
MRSDAFVNAVESMDRSAVPDVLAEDVVFHSPVVFRPYEGRDAVAAVLTEGAMNVFEDFRYIDRFESGDSAALIFEARVGDRELQGLDLLRFDGEGLVRELTVMVRPMSGLVALGEAMAREFERVGLAPPAGA